MNIKEQYILDLDNELILIEEIFKKYIKLPSDVWYIKGKRHPLESRKNLKSYAGHRLVRNEPWHPVLCLGCLYDLMELTQLQLTDYPDLFKRNPIATDDSNIVYHVDKLLDSIDVIRVYIPGADEDDLYECNNLFNTLIRNKIYPILNDHPNDIFTMDTETNLYRLLRGEEIRSYRFEEIIDLERLNELHGEYT